jgi:Mrp family chromosome partitioning ATPase
LSGPDGSLTGGVIRSADLWDALPVIAFPAERLRANGLFLNRKHPDASAVFDSLRTRLWHLCQQNGWRRVLITSPRAGAGKSLVAANLALALGRRTGGRAVLVDLALAAPGLAGLFGVTDAGDLSAYLFGESPLEQHFHRMGPGLALGFAGVAVPGACDHWHAPAVRRRLDEITARLEPDLALFDAPPLLGGDGAIALLPRVDAALLVVDATRDTASEIAASKALIEETCPLAGIVLNRADVWGAGP